MFPRAQMFAMGHKGGIVTIFFKYLFRLNNSFEKSFEVHLDPARLNVVSHATRLPEWAKLEYQQCQNCPLDPAEVKYCPIAANMSGLVSAFGDIVSVEEADITVETADRVFSKKTSAQDGLFSLMGIYMAASGCPVMDKLKPMVRYHLPFATIDETIYRVVTMYVTAQFFRMRKGLSADWELKKLVRMYEEVKKVNQGLLKRIKTAAKKESLLNAVVILDAFASFFHGLPSKSVNSIEYLFAPYFKEEEPKP